MNVIEAIEKEQLRSDIPDFRPGDTLKVYVKVVEGNRERVQLFEGVCISRNGTGVREMFTVRRIASGVGVERTFPCILRVWKRLLFPIVVLFGEPNCTTCANLRVKLPASRSAANWKTKRGLSCSPLFCIRETCCCIMLETGEIHE